MVPNNPAGSYCLPNYDSFANQYAANNPYSSSSFISVTTTTTPPGTAFVVFPSTACNVINITNTSGFTIDIQKGGSGPVIQLQSGVGEKIFGGLTNANQIGIRRTDQSVSPITIVAEAIVS